MSSPNTPAPAHGFIGVGAKLAMATVAVLAIVSAVLFVRLTDRERQGILESKQKAATMVADLFAIGIAAPLDFEDEDAITRELNDVTSNKEITCARVWTAAGKLLEHGRCEGVVSLDPTEPGHVSVFDDRLDIARAIVGPSGVSVGRTLLVFSLERENAAFSRSRTQIFWLSFVLAAATASVLILLARRLIVSPLRLLSSATRRIAHGDFSSAVQVGSRDEIGQLAEAFNRMGEALADRERKLADANRYLKDLFDHMRQAILSFGPHGRVRAAASRQATALFGRSDLEGVSIHELLYGNREEHDVDAQAFKEWLELAFETTHDGWDALVELAPREHVLRRGDGTEVGLELEFRAIGSTGAQKIEQVMLLATDVSEKRRLEHTIVTQGEEHARRLTAMRRLIAGGGQVFVAFVDAAKERFARAQLLVGSEPRTLPIAEIDEIFRHVHTIKGEARAFDLRELETECVKLEEELDELRALARGDGFAATGSVHGALTSRLARARQALEHGVEVFVAASPIGRAALDQVTVQRSEVEAVFALAKDASPELVRAVERLAARPFGEAAASLVDMTPTWAEQEGKRVQLDVVGREVRIGPSLARVLPGVLTHLVRNAIAHGMETSSERESAGKPPLGTIRAEAHTAPEGVVIVVEDDGRGLDVEQIEKRAILLGLDAHAADGATELVFTSGLTTSDGKGALAGRGVGLGAVRADLQHVGYSVAIETTPGRSTKFVLRPCASAPA